jgi:type IV secretion system protein TrbL
MPCEIEVSPDMFENFVPPALSDTECFIDYAADAVFGPITAAFADAAQDMVVTSSTFWLNMAPPPLSSGNDPNAASETVAFLQGSVAWYSMLGAVAALLLTGGALMIRSARRDSIPRAIKGMTQYIMTAFAGVALISGAVYAANEFSHWVIDRSLDGGNMGTNLAKMIISPMAPLGVVLVIGLSFLAILASAIQIAFLIFTGAALPVLTATWPVPASMSSTEFGQTWFVKQTGWLVGFILYKPAASIVYAAAFKMIGTPTGTADAIISVVSGIALITLAVLALPSLMKLVAPAVGSVASSRGAGSVIMGAAATAIPMGAAAAGAARGAQAASGSSGAAGASGGGPSGASGSNGTTNPGPTGGPGPSGGNGNPGPAGGGGGAGASGSNGTGGTPAPSRPAPASPKTPVPSTAPKGTP